MNKKEKIRLMDELKRKADTTQKAKAIKKEIAQSDKQNRQYFDKSQTTLF